MHNTVVNLGDTVLSLAGVVALPPAKAVVINLDGFHVGIRTYIDSSLNSSVRAKMVELLREGTKEECEIAAAHYAAKKAAPPVPVVETAQAAAVGAAKVETATLPGVFAAGKGSAEQALGRATLVSDSETAPAEAPISAPVKGGLLEIAVAVAAPVVAEVAAVLVEAEAVAPVLGDKPATIGQQASLLGTAKSRR